MSNYARKTNLKNETGFATWSLGNKTHWVNLKSDVDKSNIDKLINIPTNLNTSKSKVDKLDVDKLVPVPVDLSKLGGIAEKWWC